MNPTLIRVTYLNFFLFYIFFPRGRKMSLSLRFHIKWILTFYEILTGFSVLQAPDTESWILPPSIFFGPITRVASVLWQKIPYDFEQKLSHRQNVWQNFIYYRTNFQNSIIFCNENCLSSLFFSLEGKTEVIWLGN